MNNEIKMILMENPKDIAMKFLKDRNIKLGSLESRGIVLHIVDSILQLRKDFFRDIGDSYSGIYWEEYVQLLKKNDFHCGYKSCFKGKKTEELEAIFYNENGIVIYLNSFNEKFINVVRLYGAAKNGIMTGEQEKFLKLSKSYEVKMGLIAFEFDAISGVKYIIEEMQRLFSMKSKWNNVMAVNFTNYMEEAKNSTQVYQISMEKLNQCSPKVREIVL